MLMQFILPLADARILDADQHTSWPRLICPVHGWNALIAFGFPIVVSLLKGLPHLYSKILDT